MDAGTGSSCGKVTDMRTDPDLVRQRRAELNRRLRLAFIAGVEERSSREHGHGLTADELRRVLARYPGDLPGR